MLIPPGKLRIPQKQVAAELPELHSDEPAYANSLSLPVLLDSARTTIVRETDRVLPEA